MDVRKQIAALSEKVSREVPLVHNITNYVTVNDCANAILAVGGSPIMADDLQEVCEVTQVSKALVLNIGTLNERTIASMLAAGKRANEKEIPVIFDPVGAGATTFRNETARKILKEVKVSILRGNVSEISFLAGFQAFTKGVDASAANCTDAESAAKKAGEVSLARNATEGMGSFHIGILDALSRLDAEMIEEMAKIEEF